MISEKYGRNTLLVGPWGGQDGLHWDDGVHSAIRQVEICHGSGIDWINIEYDNNGSSVWSEKHGGRGGSKIDKVRLEYPDEFFISLHGHYGSLQERGGPVFVRSLTFESNKRKYGPYGIEEGTYFTFSPNHGKIVGFIGKSGWYLDAIGVYLQPLHEQVASDPIHHKFVDANPILHKPFSADPVYQKPVYVNPIIHKPTASDPVIHKPVSPLPMLHKPVADPILHNLVSADPILHPQQHIAHGNEKCELSMVQGSINQNYDIILAVRRVDGKNNHLPTHHLAKTRSNTEHKNQTIATLVPSIIEEVPNKIATGIVTCGPWGGSGGTLFDDGIYDGIRQINLKRNVGIVSIQVCYEKSGQPVWGSKNGGTGSFKTDKIIFDYPSEILSYITGYHSPAMVMGPDVIKSLTFHTTRGKHGPYGEEQGHFFSSKLNEGSTIVGFHGKKGLFMDAIGIHALIGKALPPPNSHYKEAVFSSNSKNSASYTLLANSNYQNAHPFNKVDNSQWHSSVGKRGQTDEVVQRMVKDPAPFGTGPWGGDSGKAWDDGVFTGIKQIILTLSDAITCIEFEYDRNDQSVWSVKHGGTGGQTAHRVRLEYPNEVLTCISGYFGTTKKSQGTRVIHSLTFHTSRRKYGPFGEELGTYFASGTTEGKVVGFHGRSSMYLDAIGVHMQHWLGNQKPKPSRMKMFS